MSLITRGAARLLGERGLTRRNGREGPLNQADTLWHKDVSIEDRELAALISTESDRPVPGPATALLVVDAVYSFTGSRPIPVREAITEFPTSCGERAWAALPQIALLIERFRSGGQPVIFTRPDEEFVHHAGRTTTLNSEGISVTAAELANEFHEDIAPYPGELVLAKPRASAFFATPLALVLANQGISSVVVVGGTTSGCVRATAVDASSHGLEVFVVADACFDRFDGSHARSLFDLHVKYGTVLTSDDFKFQKN